MTRKKDTTKSVCVRSSAGLRDALFDELDALRSGDANPARANATARLASEIIHTVEMELEVQKHASKIPAGSKQASEALNTPIQLGAGD